MVSPIITPFRWYDKFYKQNRYDVDCSNTCEFKLITSRGNLLPFQFKREYSGHLIDKWLLRSACDDAEPKLLSAQLSKFYGDYEQSWILDGTFSIDCGSLKSIGYDGDTASILSLLTIGKKYRLTFSVTDLSLEGTSNMYLKFLNFGTTLITNVNDLGFNEVEFTAVHANFAMQVVSSGFDANDFISITDIQIVELFSQSVNDIELDKSLIKLKNFGTTDYFVYCGSNLGISIPVGEYYSVIVTTDGTVYYSEVITVKDFLPEACNYSRLSWRNTCDLVDVVYKSSNIGCAYSNVLYLDEAVVTKPEYPFTEEGETDGNKTLKPTFQKWEKDIDFIIAKCPEFIVDAITGIRLHDTITLTRPLRKEQLQATEVETIETVEYEITPIFNDCYTNISLKLSLPDKYVDSACCSDNQLTECEECVYEVPTAPNDFTEDCEGCYAFAFDGEAANGLYLWNGGDEQFDYWAVPSGTLVCVQDAVYIYNGSVWGLVNQITGVTFNGTDAFTLTGLAYPNSYIQVEISIDGGATWVADTQIVSADEFYDPGIIVPLQMEEDVRFRIRNFTLNCEYGYSSVWIYEV